MYRANVIAALEMPIICNMQFSGIGRATESRDCFWSRAYWDAEEECMVLDQCMPKTSGVKLISFHNDATAKEMDIFFNFALCFMVGGTI